MMCNCVWKHQQTHTSILCDVLFHVHCSMCRKLSSTSFTTENSCSMQNSNITNQVIMVMQDTQLLLLTCSWKLTYDVFRKILYNKAHILHAYPPDRPEIVYSLCTRTYNNNYL